MNQITAIGIDLTRIGRAKTIFQIHTIGGSGRVLTGSQIAARAFAIYHHPHCASWRGVTLSHRERVAQSAG